MGWASSGGGVSQSDLEKLRSDLKPDTDTARDLGSPDKRWGYVYAVAAILGSIMIGSVYIGITGSGNLYINSSVEINGSINATGNITAEYFKGDGSLLTGISAGGGSVNGTDISPSKIIGDSTFVKIGSCSSDHSLSAVDSFCANGASEFNNNVFFDGSAYSYNDFYLKSGKDLIMEDAAFGNYAAQIGVSGTYDHLFLGVDQNSGYRLIFGYRSNKNKNYDHAIGSDPIFYFQSSTNPDSDNTQWGSLTHNKTQAKIETGKGNLDILPATNNISLKSLDGTIWNCGVSNSGSFICS